MARKRQTARISTARPARPPPRRYQSARGEEDVEEVVSEEEKEDTTEDVSEEDTTEEESPTPPSGLTPHDIISVNFGLNEIVACDENEGSATMSDVLTRFYFDFDRVKKGTIRGALGVKSDRGEHSIMLSTCGGLFRLLEVLDGGVVRVYDSRFVRLGTALGCSRFTTHIMQGPGTLCSRPRMTVASMLAGNHGGDMYFEVGVEDVAAEHGLYCLTLEEIMPGGAWAVEWVAFVAHFRRP